MPFADLKLKQHFNDKINRWILAEQEEILLATDGFHPLAINLLWQKDHR